MNIEKELEKYEKYLIKNKGIIVGIKPTAPREGKILFNKYKKKEETKDINNF